MNNTRLLGNPLFTKIANKSFLFVLLSISLFMGRLSPVLSQVQLNDFEVDLPIEKQNYKNALQHGDQEKALEHLIIIQQEYAGLNQWDSTRYYFGLVSELALELGNKEVHLNAYIAIMEIEGMFNNEREILKRRDKILYLDSFKEDPELNGFRKWAIYDKLARYAYDNGQSDSCIQLINRAVYHAERSPEQQVILAARRSLANYLKGMGRFDEALNELIIIESSKSFSLKESYFQTTIFELMGDVFVGLDDYDKAALYYNKMVNIAKANSYNRTLADGYNFLGQVYVWKKNPEKAIESFRQAIPICEEKKMDYEKAECWNFTAAAYMIDEDFPNAALYLDSVESVLSTIDSSTLDFIFSREKIKYHLATNDISKAANQLERLEKLEETSLYFKNQHVILNDLRYKVAAAQNKPQKALAYLEAHKAGQDSLEELFDQQRTQRLESEFNRKSQDEQIALLDREKAEQEKVLERRNKTLTVGFGFLSIVTGLLFFLLHLYRKNKAKNLVKTNFC